MSHGHASLGESTPRSIFYEQGRSLLGQLRNRRHELAQEFFAPIFDPAAVNPNDPTDLRGGTRAPVGSSTGRRSSISATAERVTTRRSTPRSGPCCSN